MTRLASATVGDKSQLPVIWPERVSPCRGCHRWGRGFTMQSPEPHLMCGFWAWPLSTLPLPDLREDLWKRQRAPPFPTSGKFEPRMPHPGYIQNPSPHPQPRCKLQTGLAALTFQSAQARPLGVCAVVDLDVRTRFGVGIHSVFVE